MPQLKEFAVANLKDHALYDVKEVMTDLSETQSGLAIKERKRSIECSYMGKKVKLGWPEGDTKLDSSENIILGLFRLFEAAPTAAAALQHSRIGGKGFEFNKMVNLFTR